MKESVLIVSPDKNLGDKMLSQIASDGKIPLETKYYTVSVPVTASVTCPAALSPNVKGVIVVEDESNQSLSFLRTLSGDDDDIVKIYFSKDEALLDACIDNGFELVRGDLRVEADLTDTESGIGRVLEALKCRIWQTDEPSTCSDSTEESPEEILNSFEALISQMQQVRNSSSTFSDDDRRARAECVASQLAKFLCQDDSDDDVTVT